MCGDTTNNEREVEGFYCYKGLRYEDELEFSIHLEESYKSFQKNEYIKWDPKPKKLLVILATCQESKKLHLE